MGRKVKKNKIYGFRNSKGIKFSVSENEINRAIRDLQLARKKAKAKAENEGCKSMRCAKQLESEIPLQCRQLASVACALRKAFMRHDWMEIIIFTSLLCQPGITRYSGVIIRACLILLFSHPKSNFELVEKFIRSCTGYEITKEVIKFVKILLSIRKEPLPVLGVGKYVRASSMYRIVDDVDFKDL